MAEIELITISLEKSDWICIAKFLSKNVGNMVDIMPVARLLQVLLDGGLFMNELE